MQDLARGLGELCEPGDRAVPPFARLAACLRAAAGARALALAVRGGEGDAAWRLHALAGASGKVLREPAELLRANARDPALPPPLAGALAAASGPCRIPLRGAWPGDFEAAAPGAGQSALVLPIAVRGAPRAALLVLGPAGAGAAEAEPLWLLANLAATALLRDSALERLRRSEAHVQRELQEVARIQRLLLPGEGLRLRGIEVAAQLDTFGLAGGDYYDFMPLTHHFEGEAGRAPGGPDVVGVLVADVTGHGVAAAVEAAMFDAVLRTYAAGPRQAPASVLRYANRHFFSRRGRPHFLTAFGALVDPAREALAYSNAGHPPALLRRPREGNRVEVLRGAAGIPIGVLEDYAFENASCRFGPEDLLVLVTDGVLEAASPAGEPFGLERLERAVREAGAAPAQVVEAVRSAVARHQAGAPVADDRTLVVLRCAAG